MGALAMLACAAPARAQDGFSSASWEAAPDPLVASDLNPYFAAMLGIDGVVRLRCLTIADGPPYRCDVAEEFPAGLGFGAAARVVAASGRIRAARRDGHVVRRWISTTIRFEGYSLDDPDGSDAGRDLSAESLALAARFVETDPVYRPSTKDDLMEGLDVDRRNVVLGWLDELLPSDFLERFNDAEIIRVARLYTANELRDLLSGKTPYTKHFDLEDYEAALPQYQREDVVALREVRRRYCERWSCHAPPRSAGRSQ